MEIEIDVFICPKCGETLNLSEYNPKLYFCTCGFRSDICGY